ncbi:MAG TPA: polysaccharide deacetylase family protein [Solirubrobacteraceae bacterium]|jgi:peptidoglycan/xylan/chitin deacetylase (PgdA/CDA1 family)|nr:polysaccharide deacetylase family protein [Solirubrobacteraceae bacterium]
MRGRFGLVVLALIACSIGVKVGRAAVVVLPHTTTSTAPAAAPTPPPSSGQTVYYRPIGCRSRPGVYRGISTHRKVVALSFDDGPYTLTPQFVSMLAAEHVPATFFMIGEEITGADAALLKRELRAGDALGDHTWTHPDLDDANVEYQLSSQLNRVQSLTGYTPCVFRPPYGDYDGHVLAVAASLHLATILWAVDPSDYTLPGVSAIEQRVLSAAQPGDIILSHDGGGPRQQTLAAYPDIINTLRRRGYSFETVPQLLGFATVYRKCIAQCGDAAISYSQVPRGSIIEPG